MKRTNTISWIISTIFKSFILAFVFTLILGYILGFRASLVISGSSEPVIATGSLVLDYHCSYSELKVGDYITFKTSDKGKVNYTTHQIVYICPEGEYIQPNSEVMFEHCGMNIKTTVGVKCQILTTLTNPLSISDTKAKYDEWKTKPENQSDDAYWTSYDRSIEKVNYSEVMGKVLYSFPNLGKFLFFLRNNFLQIIVYVIIFYIGLWLLKFEPDYEKAF